MRYVVIAALIAIVLSLGSAAVFMLRSRGDSTHMAKALTWRVGLSVALFLLLMIGYGLGFFQPGKL
ncbi:MAG TPA: twin transmembrane helix small protein [Burkholderiales bacterium]